MNKMEAFLNRKRGMYMLSRYKNILVAVDGSKNAQLAFQQAVEIALEQEKATLYVLEVVDNQTHFVAPPMLNSQTQTYSPEAVEMFQEVVQKEVEWVENEVHELVEEAKRKGVLNAVAVVTTGNHKNAIAHTIPTEKKIDLLIIGATGKGRIKSAILGTTTSYVVQHAPCNVLVVKE